MKPTREHATSNQQTYFVTSKTEQGRELFRNDRWARLFLDCLYHYRGQSYLLHEFVLMPDHFHLLITPQGSLEKSVQYIKGGFSFRAKKELGSNMEVWQRGFSDHRVRDAQDLANHIAYIHSNPVRKRLCGLAAEYPYSSAFPGSELDPVPQGLKPVLSTAAFGTAEAVPFQGNTKNSMTRHEASLMAEAEAFQSKYSGNIEKIKT